MMAVAGRMWLWWQLDGGRIRACTRKRGTYTRPSRGVYKRPMGTQRTGQNLWHFYIRRETCKSSAWKATKELLLSGPKEGKGGGKSSISPGDNGVQPLENRLLIPPLVKHSTGFSFSCPAILVVELRTLSILGKCSTTPPDRY